MPGRLRSAVLAAAVVFAAAPGARAGVLDPENAPSPPKVHTAQSICALIEASATTHGIPVEFFTRLIWRESSFRTGVVSPKGAQGIAQFMPGTASMRGLSDPFDPMEAIPASALYLSVLANRFGNVGLAAAAYNAGEKRVSDWLAGTGGLPWETQDYVLTVTGRPADEWAALDPALPAADPQKAKKTCLEVAAVLAKPGAGSQLVDSIQKAPWAPWGVQVAGGFSLNRAMASYSNLQKHYPTLLGGRLPMVLRGVNRSMGVAPIFQIRLPANTRTDANTLCQKLEASGGACVVFRTD